MNPVGEIERGWISERAFFLFFLWELERERERERERRERYEGKVKEDFVYPVLGIYAEYKIYHIVKEKEF